MFTICTRTATSEVCTRSEYFLVFESIFSRTRILAVSARMTAGLEESKTVRLTLYGPITFPQPRPQQSQARKFKACVPSRLSPSPTVAARIVGRSVVPTETEIARQHLFSPPTISPKPRWGGCGRSEMARTPSGGPNDEARAEECVNEICAQ